MPFFHFPRFPLPNNCGYFKPKVTPKIETINSNKQKKNNSKNSQDCFFELFGLNLYFDDILLISLIFFLYQEGVKDEELFVSLILLLLS